MISKRTLAAFLVTQTLVVAAAIAQQVPLTDIGDRPSLAEFGRASGGEIQVLIKHPNRLSGSLGLTANRSSLPFVSGGIAKSYEATLGGTLLQDRAWFFGTVETGRGIRFDPSITPLVAQGPSAYVKMNTQLGDRQNLAASANRGSIGTALPASFLSLHYTGIVSSNMFFTASVSRQSTSQTQPLFTAP